MRTTRALLVSQRAHWTNDCSWGIIGWISDLIPHFGYRVVTALVLLRPLPTITVITLNVPKLQ